MTTFLATAASGQQPGWVYLIVLGGLAAIALVFYLLGRWEKRGHGGRGSSIITSAGAGMLELQSLLEPSKRHVIEVKKQRKKDMHLGDDADTSDRSTP